MMKQTTTGTAMSVARASVHFFILSSSSSLQVLITFFYLRPSSFTFTCFAFTSTFHRCDHIDSGGGPVQGGGRAVQVQKADRPLRLCRSCHWSCAFHYKGLHSLAAQFQKAICVMVIFTVRLLLPSSQCALGGGGGGAEAGGQPSRQNFFGNV